VPTHTRPTLPLEGMVPASGKRGVGGWKTLSLQNKEAHPNPPALAYRFGRDLPPSGDGEEPYFRPPHACLLPRHP